jgi:hypothetical protein
MVTFIGSVFRFCASYGFAVVVLVFMLFLVLFGTLEQVDIGLLEAQKKYFESAFLVHYLFGTVPIPLPGAYLLIVLLFTNLSCGALIRARKDWRKPGMLIAHSGILLMLFSGFVEFYWSDKGHLTLNERQESDEFVSYYDWELAVTKADGALAGEQLLITHEQLVDLEASDSRRFTSSTLPFDLVVDNFERNSQPQLAPMMPGAIDGIVLLPLSLDAQAERNVAGATARVIEKDGNAEHVGLLWGFAQGPWSVAVGGDTYNVDLRHKRWKLGRGANEPFSIRLDKFVKEEHPGTSMPSNYMSQVTKRERGLNSEIEIKMNEPLRHNGYTLFQSSWGPPDARPGDPLYSVFSVVRNPSDQWPKYSCYVITFGMCIHFLQKLAMYIRREQRRRA